MPSFWRKEKKGIREKPYNPIPKQTRWILRPALCCSWVGTNTCRVDSTNPLDLTWYIFISLIGFLPLICVLLTSMINLLFPSLLWRFDFQPPQCNAKFGARRVGMSWRCTSFFSRIRFSQLSKSAVGLFPWMCPDPAIWCHSCLHMFSELLLAVCITRSVFPGWRTALGSVY